MKQQVIIILGVLILLIAGCCKHKKENVCNPNQFQVGSFNEKYGSIFCEAIITNTHIFLEKRSRLILFQNARFHLLLLFLLMNLIWSI